MTYKNPKALLDAATALPAAIEAKLPAGAPKISAKLLDLDTKLPTLPEQGHLHYRGHEEQELHPRVAQGLD